MTTETWIKNGANLHQIYRRWLGFCLQPRVDSNCAKLLNALAAYIQFRYAGEESLAIEQLSWLGHRCDAAEFRNEQFLAQIKWMAAAMELHGDVLVRLDFPE